MAESEETSEEQIAKAREFVRAEANALLAEMRAAEGQQQPPVTKDEGNNQLRELLEPLYGPHVQQARLESMSAIDESRFYRKHPEAAEREDQIEAIFRESMRNGRPWQREEINRYLIGKEAEADPDKFVEKINAKKEAQLRRAEGAMDFGFNGAGREQEVEKFKSFDKLSVEEMEKALEGVTF